MKINYTDYLKANGIEEIDPQRLIEMKNALIAALVKNGVHGRVSCKYYTDGTILVNIDGQYFNCFNSNSGKFFSGYVGD